MNRCPGRRFTLTRACRGVAATASAVVALGGCAWFGSPAPQSTESAEAAQSAAREAEARQQAAAEAAAQASAAQAAAEQERAKAWTQAQADAQAAARAAHASEAARRRAAARARARRHAPVHRPPRPVLAEPETPAAPAPIITSREWPRAQARGVLDSGVARADGRVIGRAIDVLADLDGKPQALMINLTGYLGVGDRKVTLRWSDFSFDPDAKEARVRLSSGALDEAAKMPALKDVQPVLDATVERKDGSSVGRVVDVVIDGQAQAQAMVLDVSGSIISEAREVAASWSAVRFVKQKDGIHLITELTPAQIQAASTYAPDKPIRIFAAAPSATSASAAAASSAPAR